MHRELLNLILRIIPQYTYSSRGLQSHLERERDREGGRKGGGESEGEKEREREGFVKFPALYRHASVIENDSFWSQVGPFSDN